MKTYEIYRKFIAEYRKVGEPLWQSCNGPLLSCIWEMTPREMKRCMKKQYHANSPIIKKFPLWFLGDSLQGHMPYMCNSEEWNERNIADFEYFEDQMFILMKKYHIAPRKWLNWYKGCRG